MKTKIDTLTQLSHGVLHVDMHLPLFLEFEPRIARELDEATFHTIRVFVEGCVSSFGRNSHFLCRLRALGDEQYIKIYEKRELRAPRVCIMHIRLSIEPEINTARSHKTDIV